jgi:hypothetical protein
MLKASLRERERERERGKIQKVKKIPGTILPETFVS